MLMDAEQKKEEYKDRLRFKVDELKRKEEDLIMWEDTIANRKWKLEHTKDNIVSLMRELKLKDVMLLDKTAEVTKYKRQVEDSVREVCRIMFFRCYCVFKDLKTLYGCDKGGYDDGYQVC